MLKMLFAVASILSSPPAGASENDYVSRLTASAPTAEAQFRLALWARAQGLKDISEGHLHTAVSLNPNLDEAQKALGRSFRDGRWETTEERAARLAGERRLRADVESWRSRLATRGLDSVRDTSIDEAAAVVLVEFATRSAEAALVAVKLFGASDQWAATSGLMRVALSSPFQAARQAAARALRERNPDHYLPGLLEPLQPARAGKTATLGAADIWYWQEGPTLVVSAPAPRGATGTGSRPTAAGGLEERRADAETLRAKAVAALQTATGLSIGDDYTAWHGAVANITNAFIGPPPPAMQVATVYYDPETLIVSTHISGGSTIIPQPWGPKLSCFAAGTPIATKRGLVPIDKVCLGELVLSRSSKTGETAYKPVLVRTLRPRAQMKEVVLGGEAILATAGHYFRTAAGGWTKTQDIGRGFSVAAADGATDIARVNDAAEPMQAYNLVVADFSTYFVGKSRVLVHDNTPIRDASAKR